MNYILLLSIALLAAQYDDAEARSRVPIRKFRQQVVCPATGKYEIDTPCKGYVVDHILPLCAGGVDEPRNMQWQEYNESKKKDLLELELCRKLRNTCQKGGMK